MATETPVTVDRAQLPPAGTWTFDKAHTRIEFVARHMLSKVRGRFSEFDGTVTIAERPEDSHVEVEIQAASLSTDTQMRDDHLRSDDFFQTDAFPTIDFVSTRIEPDGDDWKIHGDLTIRGVTRPVVLDAEYAGSVANMNGGTSAGFSASTRINREDFGLTWNVALESGGVMVSRDIKIAIDLEVTSETALAASDARAVA